ncbi:MAG: glutamate---cysteine ligase / carboxylate-amine ligase [Frankiaceae bacterium]|nr:glutamate---cysteine ligase / carboxylate-amine ligase [Frankiaceae bacterium]
MQINFASSPTSSVGVEMELELVDRETRELRSGATQILEQLAEDRGGEEHPNAKHELLESCIEIITDVCSTVGEARADLARTLAEVSGVASSNGLDVMCSGTHPFSRWSEQDVTPDPRYQQLIEDHQWLARRLQIFGIHVHVGVRSPDKVMPIVTALSGYVAHFLALSASSPYWLGSDTGLASARSKVFEGLPNAGLPHQLANWAEFEEYMETLVCSNTIKTIREVWWDIRPHPNFGTVELRICDGLPTLREVAAVAAMSQCLVTRFDSLLDRGYTLPTPKTWVVAQNKWRAARYGADAEIIIDERGTLQPLREAVADLVHELDPVADKLGCAEELNYALEMAQAPSYLRQRQIVAAGGSLVDVVDGLVDELRRDQPAAVA